MTPASGDEGGEHLGVAFLTVADVVDLHREAVRRFSPGESLVLRDPGLLESAVMNPQQTFDGEFLYSSLAEMAAAYLIGLALNHPFENGNKRVAFAACSIFLRINGYRLVLSQDAAVELTFNVINRVLDRPQIIRVIEDAMEEL
ncbi:MAG: type II toxin-antitoxin system death-on-curing family toxin [Armatimonadota bacterium]